MVSIMPWLLIDTNSIIDNVIEYDGVAEYTPPEGLTLVHYTGSVQASPGFPWNGTDPVPPAPPQPRQAEGNGAPNSPPVPVA